MTELEEIERELRRLSRLPHSYVTTQLFAKAWQLEQRRAVLLDEDRAGEKP